MLNPICIPFFNLQELPFVIVLDKKSGNYYIVNLKTKSVTLFLRADSRTQGFCVKTGIDSFDFHTTSMRQEIDHKWYEYHHKQEVRQDLIGFLKRCG